MMTHRTCLPASRTIISNYSEKHSLVGPHKHLPGKEVAVMTLEKEKQSHLIYSKRERKEDLGNTKMGTCTLHTVLQPKPFLPPVLPKKPYIIPSVASISPQSSIRTLKEIRIAGFALNRIVKAYRISLAIRLVQLEMY